MQVDNKQVMEQENRLISAISTGDHRILDELLHPSVVLVHPSGQVLNKKMYMQFYRKYQVDVTQLNPSDYFINIAGDTATVTLLVKLAWSVAEQDHTGIYRYIRTWKSTDGKFELLSAACVQLNPC